MSGRPAVPWFAAAEFEAYRRRFAADLVVLGRYRPCPHWDPDKRLGDGMTWARCTDCGATFQQASAPRFLAATQAFEEAHERIDARFTAAAATIEAMRALLLTAQIDDGTTGCVDAAARALAAFDAAMR